MLNAEDGSAFMDINKYSEEIDSEDAWAVIRAYFKQHGLVSQ